MAPLFAAFAVAADPHAHGAVERGPEEVEAGRPALLQQRLLVRARRHERALVHLQMRFTLI